MVFLHWALIEWNYPFIWSQTIIWASIKSNREKMYRTNERTNDNRAHSQMGPIDRQNCKKKIVRLWSEFAVSLICVYALLLFATSNNCESHMQIIDRIMLSVSFRSRRRRRHRPFVHRNLHNIDFTFVSARSCPFAWSSSTRQRCRPQDAMNEIEYFPLILYH